MLQKTQLMEDTVQFKKEEARVKLLEARSHIENEIKRMESIEHARSAQKFLMDVRDINDSLIRMQDELNRAWKRTEHLLEDIQVFLSKTEQI